MCFGDWLIKLGIALGGKTTERWPEAPPGPHLDISASLVRKILREVLGPTGYIHLPDYNLWLCDLEDIETFLDWDETNHFKYASEIYDCDDFAKRLYGQFAVPGWSHFAFGLIWTTKHAMNIMIDTNRDVWAIEPQTDKRRSALIEFNEKTLNWLVIG